MRVLSHIKPLLVIGLLTGLTGCGLFLPTPAHRATATVEPEMSNPDFTDRLLAVLSEEGLSECRGTPRLDESLPVCSIPFWQGNVTRVDRDRAIVEVGDFPAYGTNSVGHSARFRRVSDDTLEITVKGVFFYYGPIPNEEVARGLAIILEGRL